MHEGRITKDYKFENDGIINFNFETKDFPHDEAIDLIISTYSKLVNEGGPWPFRVFENLLNGYLNLKGNKEYVFLNRAKIYKSMLLKSGILAFSSRLFFFGKGFRRRWNKTMWQLLKTFPYLFFLDLFLLPIVGFILLFLYLIANVIYYINPKGEQPDFIRTVYDGID